MIIKDMFEKPIDRDIKGVIKVGQKTEENIFQELNEYVVTNELQKHFRDFFEGYEKGINNFTDEMGVWISGHFGSGKSHLLKILSYILENKKVEGKHAIDFFKNQGKIKDPIVLANMDESTNVSTDVVLFNIDSKSSGSDKDKDPIVNVFLKVFNELQGFSGEHPSLADFERNLTKKGTYEQFKEEFEKISSNRWEDQRDDFLFVQDDIIEALVKIGWSEDAASRWADSAEENYSISIEKFASLVKEYCESKGSNHHIIFLVDEIGQYIGDNSKLMLNLQTVTEDLGIQCGGKAWVIVTSQEAIDSMLEIKGQDFSKIQGRFKTRLSLSSANVDEVIRRRILEKGDIATESLEALYETKEAILKNLITFTQDTAFKKMYGDKKEFSNVYPFIPYQFDLVANVLNAIRIHGASGKHLSEGERSMLALFQESATEIMDKETGTLVPFYIFYEALHRFVDSTHSTVIIKAGNNEYLDNFDVNVLKVLFMIKYVKEIDANLENLTTLMVDHVDVDRIDLNKKIAKSLNNLERETLISKNGDIYSFLTNEEQDINRAINNENVEIGEIQNHITEVVFEDIYNASKYRYDNRYNFDFNKAVDGRYKGNKQSSDIGLHIISSYYEFSNSSSESQSTLASQNDYEKESLALKGMSELNKEVIIRLKDDEIIFDEIRGMIQIIRYLNKQSTSFRESSKSIINDKKQEVQDKKERIRLAIEESLQSSDIYVDGNKTEINEKNAVIRIDDGLKRLVDNAYYKLSYMESKPTEVDIKNVLLHRLEDKFAESKDQLALDDLISHIDNQTKIEKPSLKSIMDRYKKAPYGFVEDDIKYLIATLFANKSIYLIKNSQQIVLGKDRPEDILKSFKTKSEQEKILIDKKQTIENIKKTTAKDILKEFFSLQNAPDDQEDLKEKFLQELNNYDKILDDILVEYKLESRFPGKNIVEKTKELFKETKRINSTKDFFDFISDNEDEFLDLSDDLDYVKQFFEGSQKEIFINACKILAIFEANELKLRNEDLINLNEEIKRIISMDSPYSNIPKLPEIYGEFKSIYEKILETKKGKIRENIDSNKTQVLEILNDEILKNEFQDKINVRFESLENKLNNKTDVYGLDEFTDFSDDLKNEFFEKIRNFLEKQTPDSGEGEKPVIPTIKTIKIKNILNESSLSIKNEEDIDIFIEKLKNNLKKEFEELKDEKGSINLKF
ncbi:MAG: BREX system P-loop protein BrxC [Methanobrevibacter sp.]|nr:BREX system P-loop protein BrxC [Methanobrevibacter sp.]